VVLMIMGCIVGLDVRNAALICVFEKVGFNIVKEFVEDGELYMFVCCDC